MPTTTLSPVPLLSFLDNNGRPLVGGQLFTYQAGTTTKLATYADSTGGTPNSNPVILDYRGEAPVWIPPNVAYKFVLSPANDTDPPTNPIWTVDQIVNAQLITLYGGVDTGSADAYILNFVANFPAYADGIIIYWLPANTNTGPSTINVNGLGPVAIINQDGSALYAGQIRAAEFAQIIYLGGAFVLMSDTASAAFSAYRSASAQSMPASTVTDCIFNSAAINQGSAYNTATGIFTAPSYGIYSFSASIRLAAVGTNAALNAIYFSKNDNTSGGGLVFLVGTGAAGALYTGAGDATFFAGNCIVPLDAGDTMRLKWDAGTAGAGTNSLDQVSSFSGARVA
jgi:hypothetical protein